MDIDELVRASEELHRPQGHSASQNELYFSRNDLENIAKFLGKAQPENAYQLYKNGRNILVAGEAGQAAQTRLFTPENHPDIGRIERRWVETGETWPTHKAALIWIPPFRD